MAKPIVVVGSINLDLVANAARLPAPGETVFGTQFRTFFGGKGANQAVAAAKLGHPVLMIGKVGEDAFGSQLLDGLNQAGVGTACIGRTPGPSGTAIIVTDDHGENSIVVIPGANSQVLPADIERHRDVLGNAGMILTQLEIPLETVEMLCRIAKKQNIPLVLDPAPARPLPASILQNVTWITPNEIESQILLTDSAAGSPDSAADRLFAAGVSHVVLKLGARGALVAEDPGTRHLVPGFPVKAVDTTAAGDAFNGAFAVGLLEEKSPEQAARFANAVAAISVTRPGAQPSMPTRKEVDEFLRIQEGR